MIKEIFIKQFKPPEKMVRNVSHSHPFVRQLVTIFLLLILPLLSSGHFIRDYQVVENNSK
jgi:hypothetical protein